MRSFGMSEQQVEQVWVGFRAGESLSQIGRREKELPEVSHISLTHRVGRITYRTLRASGEAAEQAGAIFDQFCDDPQRL